MKMVDREIAAQLKAWANQYETADFIKNDPIQIPYRYTDKRDIEISAFVTAWLAWGNRKQIIAKADYIDREIFKGKPYEYIISGEWATYHGNNHSIYRTFTYSDFADMCCILRSIYNRCEDMEDNLSNQSNYFGVPVLDIIINSFFGVKGFPHPANDSACKRLNLFLRWMCRRGPVDLGAWDIINPAHLLIPLDTHVLRMAQKLGLTTRASADMTNAKIITAALAEVFPDDPCRGDFALFGYGVNTKQ